MKMKILFQVVLFLAVSTLALPLQSRADDSYQCAITVYRAGRLVAESDLTLSKTPEYSVSASTTPLVVGTNGWKTLPSVDQKTGKPVSGLDFVIKTVKEESGSYHYAIEARKYLSSKPIAEVYTDSLDHKVGFKVKTMGYLHVAECGPGMARANTPDAAKILIQEPAMEVPALSTTNSLPNPVEAPAQETQPTKDAAESPASSTVLESSSTPASTPVTAEVPTEAPGTPSPANSVDSVSKAVISPYSPGDLTKLKSAFQRARETHPSSAGASAKTLSTSGAGQ
jgi:hypothetical protein